MEYELVEETFESLYAHWKARQKDFLWFCPFMLPFWMETWWKTFAFDHKPHIYSIRTEGKILGIAPLIFQKDTARLIGNPDVCDYLDFVVLPGHEAQFFHLLMECVKAHGIKTLDLNPVRADSSVTNKLLPVAEALGFETAISEEDVSLERTLPGSWNDFLESLSGKERHEIRRKLRRIEEAGELEFRMVSDEMAIDGAMTTFLDLFGRNRSDKARFMNEPMSRFFRSMARSLAKEAMLRLYLLNLNSVPVASVLCFDVGNRFFLYNNAYDDRFRSLSVGLLSKVLTVKDAIERGKKVYDFLKGGEPYKYRLGGKPVKIYRCHVRTKS